MPETCEPSCPLPKLNALPLQRPVPELQQLPCWRWELGRDSLYRRGHTAADHSVLEIGQDPISSSNEVLST